MRIIHPLRFILLICLACCAKASFAWDKYLWHGSSFHPFTADTTFSIHSEKDTRSFTSADLDIRQSDFSLSTAITDLSGDIRRHHTYCIVLIGADSDTLRISITPQPAAITDDISQESLKIAVSTSRYSSPLTVKEITSDKIRLSRLPNQFNISRRGSKCHIGAGKADNVWQYTATDIFPTDIIAVGFETSGPCTIQIPRIALSTSTPFDSHGEIATATVDSILRQTTDKKVACWTMLDYSLDNKALHPGGQYKIAIIPADNTGYDIIYLAGAEMHPSDWYPGMVKGHLSPTSLPSLFNLTWYDIHGRKLDQYATLQFDPTGKLFTITFPMRASTIRFHKIPRSEHNEDAWR